MRDSDPLLELTRRIPTGRGRSARARDARPSEPRTRPIAEFRRSSQRKVTPRGTPPPPPPPIGAASVGVRLAELARSYPEPKIVDPQRMRPKFESISDFEDTRVRLVPPVPALAVATATAEPLAIERELALPPATPASVAIVSRPGGARVWELVLVALASAVLTLSLDRTLELRRARIHHEQLVLQGAPSATQSIRAPMAAAAAVPTFPIVRLTDLPLVAGRAREPSALATSASASAERPGAERPSAEHPSAEHPSAERAIKAAAFPTHKTAENGPDRAALAAAIMRSARSAKSCGEGPEMAQVIVSYAPSGVPKSVRFGSVAPSRSLRGCVLGAMSRAVIPPFNGEPVTVEKTISW